MIRLLALILALSVTPAAAVAQDREQTLADIRQALSVLHVEVQRLRRELLTTGAPGELVGGSTPLERIDVIERELQRLTARTEEIGFRVERIAVQGGNRIGDLEFRLCELEAACDIADLTDGGTTLDGAVPDTVVIAEPDSAPDGAEMAVGEKADFERAQAALEAGELQSAAEQFAAFVETYPGGPLSAEAYFLRGDALEQLGQVQSAARAYLDSFSITPDGPIAPDALYKVGVTLAALGAAEDACRMLDQVGVRFPGSGAHDEAGVAMAEIGCP